ncbi:VOC family protein [Leucobacter allii]|uniref:VOC family protein n=1 Tax=Leucobacter allii TaxID=2932247 RepID=UPI001FD02D60|nr:VOC family protein [Leucobacter allii]UOR02848.1 VOC family protein [Leucobacter allii]
MSAGAPGVYLLFPGNAAEALAYYRDVFGGELELHDYAAFGRTDGPGDAIAHGVLTGPVALAGADAGPDDDAVHMGGMFLSLLGTAPVAELARCFAALAAEGRIIEPFVRRPWGAIDGQLVDRYGVRWLIGSEDDPAA